jgi:hypothetical protein
MKSPNALGKSLPAKPSKREPMVRKAVKISVRETKAKTGGTSKKSITGKSDSTP